MRDRLKTMEGYDAIRKAGQEEVGKEEEGQEEEQEDSYEQESGKATKEDGKLLAWLKLIFRFFLKLKSRIW